MEDALDRLVALSRRYGSDPEYVIGGGGNTSWKDERYLWVKASGVALATITREGFVRMDRAALKKIGERTYSRDVRERERQVKEDLLAARADPSTSLRPSVETSLHELIEYPFVVHTHPTLVNALMCSRETEQRTRELFGEDIFFVGPAAGYTLFREVKERLPQWRARQGSDPRIIFLQNHGIFVSGDTPEEIDTLYHEVMETLRKVVRPETVEYLPVTEKAEQLRQELARHAGGKEVVVRHSSLHRHFYGSREAFRDVAVPFTPDILVYCGPEYAYSDKEELPDILGEVMSAFTAARRSHGLDPRVVLVKDLGLFALADKEKLAVTILDIFEDAMKIALGSRRFGGPRPLPPEVIDFIMGWEAESYRMRIAGQ